MYAITGVTGHVGRAAADALLGKGEPVRAVVRDAAKGAAWSARGAEVAVADFSDSAALAEALRGCRGVFIMQPVVPVDSDLDAYHRRLSDTIADGVRDSGVPHVVLLSSLGADRPEGTGPIRWLHYFENRLRETGTLLTVVRSPHFQEKVEELLGAVAGGIYPVFADSAEIPTTMVATRDIGAVVAESLRTPPPASEIIDLDGSQYTEREVADRLAAVLGKPLTVVTIPRPGWIGALVDGGVPPLIAAELAALYAAEQSGELVPVGDRRVGCATDIEHTLREVVSVDA